MPCIYDMVFSSVFICYVVMVSNLFSLFSRAFRIPSSVSKIGVFGGRSLHDAMCALGLTRYEDTRLPAKRHRKTHVTIVLKVEIILKPAQEDEMNDFLNHLATFLDLHFEAPEAMRCILTHQLS